MMLLTQNDFLTMEVTYHEGSEVVCSWVDITINLQVNGKLKRHIISLVVLPGKDVKNMEIPEERKHLNYIRDYGELNGASYLLKSLGYEVDSYYTKISDLINPNQKDIIAKN